MDFWTHQENARRRTFRLVLLYAILVLGFSLLAAFAIDLVWTSFYPDTGRFAQYRPSGDPLDLLIFFRFPIILIAIPALAGVMTLFAPASLSSGGRSVAESMKGVLIQPQTRDSGERRLLNVVEEMAIASGVPVPPVYLLKNEQSINAFAAGATINDAIIGVTQGTVTYLDRSELQAVIAHEFSHILNGDMRLNLRFARLLFGLMCLAEVGSLVLRGVGRGSSRNRKDSKGAGLVMAIALVCYIIGLLMAFLGRIVQAAVNRQREFLADASSVQFTRTNSLASALKKIGGLSQGSLLTETAMSGNYSHFFFCRTGRSLFSTHPSLKERISRLDSSWDGAYTAPVPVQAEEPDAGARRGSLATWSGQPSTASEILLSPLGPVLAAADQDAPMEREGALAKLRAACSEPLDACHLIFSLLLAKEPHIQEKQLETVGSPERRRLICEYRQAADALSREDYLPLIELAVPALKLLSHRQYAVFHAAMRRYIEADAEFSFKEWILYQLVSSRVGAQYAPEPSIRPVYARVRDASVSLLAALAWLEPDGEEAQNAFTEGLKAMQLPSRPLPEKPDPETLVRSMDTLRHSFEDQRDAFISGAKAIVAHDNRLTAEEAMFMRLISLCLARPVPQVNVGQ